MIRARFAVVLAGCAVLVAGTSGCGSDERPPAPASMSGSDESGARGFEGDRSAGGTGGGASFEAGAYPPGPYGEDDPQVGEVIENLSLKGYRAGAVEALGAERPLVETSLSEFRESGSRYLLIHIAAVWCSSCKRAAADLGARGQELLDAGGVVLELLHEGNSGGLPTAEELQLWVEQYDLTVATFGAVDERPRLVFPSRELAYIVDLRSMTVVWRQEGLYADPTIADIAADTMLSEFL